MLFELTFKVVVPGKGDRTRRRCWHCPRRGKSSEHVCPRPGSYVPLIFMVCPTEPLLIACFRPGGDHILGVFQYEVVVDRSTYCTYDLGRGARHRQNDVRTRQAIAIHSNAVARALILRNRHGLTDIASMYWFVRGSNYIARQLSNMAPTLSLVSSFSLRFAAGTGLMLNCATSPEPGTVLPLQFVLVDQFWPEVVGCHV